MESQRVISRPIAHRPITRSKGSTTSIASNPAPPSAANERPSVEPMNNSRTIHPPGPFRKRKKKRDRVFFVQYPASIHRESCTVHSPTRVQYKIPCHTTFCLPSNHNHIFTYTVKQQTKSKCVKACAILA